MEAEIIKIIQGIANPALDAFFLFITKFGEEGIFILFIALVYWLYNKDMAIKIGFVMLLSTILNVGMKEYFAVKRPFEVLDWIRHLPTKTARGSSFPSGHTQSAATFYTYMTLMVSSKWMFLGIPLTAAVAVSRVYIGVHWPKDVVYAILIGMTVGGAMYLLCKNINTSFISILMAAIGAAAIFYLKVPEAQKLGGAIIGLSAGHIVESNYIVFADVKNFMEGVARVLLGLLISAAGYILLRYLIPELFMIRYIAVSFIATGIVPFLFRKERNTYY